MYDSPQPRHEAIIDAPATPATILRLLYDVIAQNREIIRQNARTHHTLAQLLKGNHHMAETLRDVDNEITAVTTALSDASKSILASVQALVSKQTAGEDTTPEVNKLTDIANGLSQLTNQVQTLATAAAPGTGTPPSTDGTQTATNAAPPSNPTGEPGTAAPATGTDSAASTGTAGTANAGTPAPQAGI